MSQSSTGLSASITSFKTGSGSSADSSTGGNFDMSSTCTGDMSLLGLPGGSRARAESFVSLAPSIGSTEPKVNNRSGGNPSTQGQHNRSKSADLPKIDAFPVTTSSNLGSITEMKNDNTSEVVGGSGSFGSSGKKGDQDIITDESMGPSNRSSTNTDTSFESSSTSPPSGGGNLPGSSNPDSGGGGSMPPESPQSKKVRRRAPSEGPISLLSSVNTSSTGSHNRKASSNILSNIFSTSYNKVLEDFRKLFPPDDYNGNQGLLLTHYSCALQTDPGLLEQGRLFVTSQGIYFTSFLRLKLRIFINFSEVEFLKKHQVMVVFPTAILICKKDGTNTVFASFRARDKSLALVNHYFQCFQKDPMFFHNHRELFLKELTRNYGAKFIPPSHSEEEITEESENSSEKDCGSESNKDDKTPSDGSKLQIATASNSSRFSMDDGKSTNSSTNEIAVEHEIIKVPKKRETSQDRASRTLTRDKDDDLMKDPATSVRGFYDNDVDYGNEDDDDENETQITSSESEVQCGCEVHDTKSGWTQYLDNVYYISVDSAFNMLFEKSDFYNDVLKRRSATKFFCGKWKKVQGGKGGQRERQLTYVMPTNSSVPVAPKVVDVTEMQYVDATECESKKIYTAKTKIKNHGKFSDSFVIHIKYCLTKNSRQRFRFQMSTKLEFVSSWVLMKDLIREQVDEGMKSHCDALDKALQLKISESKMGGGNVAVGARQPLSNQTHSHHNIPSGGPSPLQSSAGGVLGAGGSNEYSGFNANAADQFKPGGGPGGFYDGMGDERRERSVSIHSAPYMTQQSRTGTIDYNTYSRQGSLDVGPAGVYHPHNSTTASMFHSITYQLQSSTLLKTLAIILFFLACVSHSLLIYQLSTISQPLSAVSLYSSYSSSPPLPANIHPSSSSSPSPHLPDPDSQHTKEPLESTILGDLNMDKIFSDNTNGEKSKQREENSSENSRNKNKDVSGDQLFNMILASHLQQQNQFQLILKNSLNLLEVMTSNVNNMQVLVSSQITQHEAIMKQFLNANGKEYSCTKSPNAEPPQCRADDLKDVNKSGQSRQKDGESSKIEGKLKVEKV